jgi:hypothetical protein
MRHVLVVEDRVPAGGGSEAPGSSAGLARSLVEFEVQLQRERPDVVQIADASDAALAAAIVAAKLLIPIEAAGLAGDESVNARLIARLAA